MGIFAPQGIIVVVMMVIRRSFSFSMVRAPMTAGTVQPKPIRRGMKALPDRPKWRRVRSITKAARAI